MTDAALRPISLDLRDHVAVVTGAAQGIGRGCALMLAAHGAVVIVADRNGDLAAEVAAEATAAGYRAEGMALDVADESQVAAAFAGITLRHGRVSALVNAAGVISPNVSAEEAEGADFDRVIAVNLKGTMLCGKHAARQMIGRGGGRIVNIASQAALLSLPHQSVYTASKGGVVALTRSQAIDWAEHGINVNCICPTFIRTPMAQPMLDDPAVMRAVRKRIPLGRVGEPEDIGAVALFLISEMSSLMTGQILAVDGGWSAGEPGLDL